MDTLERYFTQSHFASVQDIIDEKNRQGIEQAIALSNLFILAMIVGTLVLGFMAVPKICTDQTERGKNTRLGMYVLLLMTGGQIGWLYILLWLAKVNVCN
jgi:hypothetical protein